MVVGGNERCPSELLSESFVIEVFGYEWFLYSKMALSLILVVFLSASNEVGWLRIDWILSKD